MVFKKKKKGPFESNRILDTSEVKIDQVFTKDEQPVALFITITEDEAKKIGVEGYVGPTELGGGGQYERDKTWVTKAIYFPTNIPGAQFTPGIGEQMRDSVAVGGTLVPANVHFEKAEVEKAYPISGSASLRVQDNWHVEIDGKIVLAPPSLPIYMRFIPCPSCGKQIDATYKRCPHCGKLF